MKNISKNKLAEALQNQTPDSFEILPSQLIQSFQRGETAAFQYFLWHHLTLAELSYEHLAARNGNPDLLTEKIATTLFKALKNQILTPDFGGWVKNKSAAVAVQFQRELAEIKTPEKLH